MQLFDLREPVNAWSHGAGMILALPVTWMLLRRCRALINGGGVVHWHDWTREQAIKAICLWIFGFNLAICYGMSATFHGARLAGDSLGRLQRLDHVGIYLLIAGTYTPVAWSLMRGTWRWGTLATVWTVAFAARQGLVRRTLAAGGLDPGLLDDGLGVVILLPRAVADVLSPDITAVADGRRLLQHWRGDQPGSLAGLLSRGVRGSRAIPLLRDGGKCLARLFYARSGRPGSGIGDLAAASQRSAGPCDQHFHQFPPWKLLASSFRPTDPEKSR